jgi:DNA-binding response OmpR family regulator
LLARIQARLRQTNNQPNNNLLTCQDLTVDLNKLEVTRSGKKIELTAKEFDLLKYLMVNKSRILTRDKILDEVWGYSVYVDTRVVDVHVGKLRKKLETGFKGKLLETIRGFGYKMNC